MVHQSMKMDLLFSQLKMKVTRQLWLTLQTLTTLSWTVPLFHLLQTLRHHKGKILLKTVIFNRVVFGKFSSSSLCAIPAQENKGQSCITQPSWSTPISPEDILNLLQQNAPPGFKCCLTLVPIETDSLGKVLKNQMLAKNTNKKD